MANNKKKFLFVTVYADIIDLAWKIKNEGNEVKFYIEDKDVKDIGDGFVDKVEKWEDFKDWADVICYHKNTMILTKRGWIKISELTENDVVATLNDAVYLEWQKPVKFIKKYFSGELLSYESEQIKFAVTSRHNMYVKYRKRNRENFSLTPIDEIYNKTHIEFKKDCKWLGNKIDNIIVPKYEVNFECGRPKILRKISYEEKRYDAKLFMSFLGFYIAEGCVKFSNGKNPVTVSIGQKEGKTLCDFKELLEKLKIKYSLSKRKGDFYEILIHNCQLANYLLQFGRGAKNKYIPEFFKELSSDLLYELYSWFKRGDGSSTYVSTSSIQLSKDLVEVGLKIGVILKLEIKPPFRMKTGYFCKEQYVLIENKKKTTPIIRNKNGWKKIPYDDFVYCIEVPNHIIYVSYKNTSMWCGNCFDETGFGSIAEKLRKEGKLVIGGSVYTDKLEMDRNFGYQEMIASGINVIPSWAFTDFDEAIKFIQKNPDRYVVKPCGKQDEKELSFVGEEEDGKDVIQILELYKLRWAKKVKTFQLQKFISGVEIAVGAFFNGEDFIYPINVNFEHKRLFPGNIGPSTWEMGTSMFWVSSNIIFNETLTKMKEKLKQSGYVGYIDINCIVNGRGIYPLEFTSRFGYPTISIQIEGILSEWGEFLYSLAKKEKFELKAKKGFQVGVVIAVPPFPFTDIDAFKKYSEDAAIIFKKPILEGVHIANVKLVDGNYIVAGVDGFVLIIVGNGTTMEETRKNVYNKISNITIPNMFYRTDIGERWFTDSDKLFAWGYI